jgi:16S rRNA (cytosine967-C5)-methyltransferase
VPAGGARGEADKGGPPGHGGAARRPTTPASPPGGGDDPARAVALRLLAAVRERDAYANLALPALLRDYRLSGRDAALATELSYGTCRAAGLLDAVLAECSDRELAAIDGAVLDALRLGAYQLLRTRVPAHAAVSTTVQAVREALGRGAAGFANAVLRRVAEHDEAAWVARLAPDAEADPIGRSAFTHAHPVWIAQAFADALGSRAGELDAALAADDSRPEVHLAARPGAVTAEELAAISGGEPGPWSPYAVRLDGGDPGRLDAVREGLAVVQDEGSQLVALAFARAPLTGPDGGRWLDLCAGPGGKAVLLGALVGLDGGSLDAVERAPHRAELVERACADLPVRVHVADGRDAGLAGLIGAPDGGFDRVLVDAPCTGLGALRRRPEARWRRRPGDLPALTALQRELVLAALRLVRPGGVVCYATCSPHLAETLGVTREVLRRADGPDGPPGGAEPVDARDLLPGVPELGDGPYVQLWPHRQGTDAMFCALLRRRG